MREHAHETTTHKRTWNSLRLCRVPATRLRLPLHLATAPYKDFNTLSKARCLSANPTVDYPTTYFTTDVQLSNYRILLSVSPSSTPPSYLLGTHNSPYFIPFPSHSTYSLSVNLQSFYDLAKAYTKLPSLLSPSTSLTTHFSIRLTGASSSRLARCSAVSGSSSRVSLSLEEKQGTVSDNRANRWQDRGGREEGGTGKERERKKRSFPVSSAGLWRRVVRECDRGHGGQGGGT